MVALFDRRLWFPDDDCALVRAAIRPDLGPRDLPDALIDSEIYAQYAVRDVMTRVPVWSTLSNEQIGNLHTAVILLAAALLVPVVPQPARKTIGPYVDEYVPAKTDRVAELRAQAATLLDAVGATLDAEPLAIPTFFTLGRGGRGGAPTFAASPPSPPHLSFPSPPEGL